MINGQLLSDQLR